MGRNFPTPNYFGLEPASFPANCKRGYQAYLIIDDDDELLAGSLTLLTEEFPILGGFVAVEEPDTPWPGWRTYHLNLGCTFTGGMMIGQHSVGLLYGNGHSKPYNYEIVLELIFENGTLQEVHDRSQLAADLRVWFEEAVDDPDLPSEERPSVADVDYEFAARCAYAYADLE